MYTITEHVLICWKWLLSFPKSSWTFDDYPRSVRRNDAGDPSIAWSAQFLNWPGPIGLGITPDAALEHLRRNFEEIVQHRRDAGEPMPRPGVSEPVRFATSSRVDSHPELRDEFIERIFQWGPGHPVFISDESSLFDFGDEREVEHLRGLIRSNYGIETADLGKALIVDILERIAEKRAKSRA